MTKQEERFLELLQRRARRDAPTANAERLARQEWARDVTSLLTSMQRWLSKAVSRRLMSVERRRVTLDEAPGGAYSLPALTIRATGGRSIRIDPTGREIVGALGRIDLTAGTRGVMILRFAPGQWHFVRPLARPGEWDSEPFAEDSFFKVLQELLE